MQYNLGFLTSPSAVGHVQVNDKLEIMEPVHHKKAIGVYKFGEGQTAQDRRLKRNSRRALRRKKARINFLNQEFKSAIKQADPCFFDRLKQSGLSPLDTSKKYRTVLFDRPNVESYYNKTYPTIWHLEKYLMTTNEKADIRLIYWALHNLLINRGHFYNTTPLSQFKPGRIDLKRNLADLNALTEIKLLDFGKAGKHELHLLKTLTSRTTALRNKVKDLKKFLVITTDDKTATKKSAQAAVQFLNGILGSNFQLDKVLDLDLDKDAAKNYKLNLADEMLDDKLEAISSNLSDQALRLIEIMQELFASLMLNDILSGTDSLVDAKIKAYDKHKRDRNLFFKYLDKLPSAEKERLRQAFTLYIGSRKRDLLKARQELGVGTAKNYSQDDFYKEIKKSLKKHNALPEAKKIDELISQNAFLLKLRSKDNVYVPNQLNALTFNQILQNQGRFYPFLIAPNPAKPDIKNAPYKLSQLMQFTVPYYVGPLKTEKEAAQEGIPNNHRFCWMVRKNPGAITPWNFYDKIDLDKTADHFIKRAIARDSFLLSELVLPASSLLYQKYAVLDELSNISINNKKLSGKLKHILLENVFKKHASVSKKMVIDELKKYNVHVLSFAGLSDLSKSPKFNNGLTTYYSWSKVFPNEIDDPIKQRDLEQMIEWSTVFEDRRILKRKLSEIDWLTAKQKQFVVNQRLTGWGRLSRKLLIGIKNKHGQSVIDVMENTAKNFMQVIHMQDFKEQIDALHDQAAKHMSADDILDSSFVSPANHKAIKSTLKVLRDYIKVNHGQKPNKIFLTFERSKEEAGKLTENKTKQLKNIYSQIDDKLLTPALRSDLRKTAKDMHYQLTPKQIAYFKQLGRDILTGESLNLNDLNRYSLAHIIPRKELIDDSQNNLILTNEKLNGESICVKYANKANKLGMSNLAFWQKLQALSLISKAELRNLQTDINQMSPYETCGYTMRQLVSHNQIIKVLATILQAKYPEIKVIEVRHEQIMAIRYQFDFYRLKEYNDYYRGFDAYLASVVGQYLYTVYPKARPLFVYGEYLRKNKEQNDKFNENSSHRFNFLWRLLYGKDERININHTETLAFDRDKLISQMQTVYDYKYQNIVLAPETRFGQLFKETLFPRSSRDSAKTRKLISKKRDLSTDIYGGYSNNNDAFMSLVCVKRANKPDFVGFFGVPCRYGVQAKNNMQMLRSVLKSIIKQNIKQCEDFRILKPFVPFKQVLLQDGGKKLLSSSSYGYNARECILNKESQKTLADLVLDPSYFSHKKIKEDLPADKRLNALYRDLAREIKDYMPSFNINKNVNKIVDNEAKFDKLETADKISVIKKILLICYVNSSSSNLSELGISSLLNFQIKHNPVNKTSVLIYQSPSGLKESRVKIQDLL